LKSSWVKANLVKEIRKEYSEFPKFKTANNLGDYQRLFDKTHTETDIKTKIVILNSNPKAYNIDKFLSFLSNKNTVFLFYFIGINETEITKKVLVSVFQSDLLKGTSSLKHWAKRNSRGVTQFMGKTIDGLLNSPSRDINEDVSRAFLLDLIDA